MQLDKEIILGHTGRNPWTNRENKPYPKREALITTRPGPRSGAFELETLTARAG